MESQEQDEVGRQARIGAANRRIARELENLQQSFPTSGATARFFCTCGRDDCNELIAMPVEEHRFVRERPYRFVVAPGHAAEVDEVIARTDAYEIVEIKPRYRTLLHRANLGRPRTVTVDTDGFVAATALAARLGPYRAETVPAAEGSRVVLRDVQADALRPILDAINDWATLHDVEEVPIRVNGQEYTLRGGRLRWGALDDEALELDEASA